MEAQFVEALRYKPEGRKFDSRWGRLLNPSGRTMVLGSTQPLTENRSYLLEGKGGRLTTCYFHVPTV
jgi:hypothetical protein